MKKRLLVLVLATLAFYFLPLGVLSSAPSICIYRLLSAHECITCGTTRAYWCILHLDFQQALIFNRFSVLTFPAVGIGLLSWVFQFNLLNTARIIRRRCRDKWATKQVFFRP